ncbi:hypothetical protein GCM10011411_17420 [Aurantiacibacter arachoides]|nr:hypothetical protein GCM10011411_17420 [Aurantiacibacter arachoides]
MRVCLATDSLAPSGMGVHMLALADALEDCAVTIVAVPGTDLFEAARSHHPVRAWTDDAAFDTWLRASGFAIVHVHAGIGWEGHGLVRAAARAGIPVVRTEHLPCLITDDGQRADYAEVTRQAAAVIAVSDAVAASYRDSGLLHEAPDVTTVRNGIAVPASPAPATLARYERDAARPLLLSVGRLTAQKRHDLLIDAVGILAGQGRPVDLAIVGDGPDRAALIEHLRTSDMAGHVRLLGERRDVSSLMASADLYVHAAAFEGLPLVLLEAMAARLPIVAVPGPGIDETLDADTALLASADDAPALAAAIAAALDDPAGAQARAATAASRQADHFTAARMASETRAIYQAHARKDAPLPSLRIGFVGAGGIAQRHAGVLATMDDVRIAAVCDAAAARAGEMAAGHGAQVFADVSEMLAADLCDAVFVCVPPFAHGPIEAALIAANLPFFVEKPVALSLADAERTADAIDAAGLITGVGYHWRWLDTLDAVRDALGGRRVRLASGYWLDSTPPVDWWGRQDQSGGQMAEQATHLIDLARYLCGDVELAFGLAEHSPRDAFPTLDVATASSASLRFADGAIANFAATCLLGWNHRVGLHLFGDGFAVEITDHDVMIDVGAGRPVTPNHSDPVWRQDRAFVEAVMGHGNAIRCTYRDALETLRVTEAVSQSARTGQAIRIKGATAETPVQAPVQERAA